MTTTADNVAAFTEVDAGTDTSWFIEFMDAANRLPDYATMRGLLRDQLGPLRGANVLDVGCGTGDDARELAAAVGPTGQVVGVDASAAMIAEATRRSADDPAPVRFRQADVYALDVPDGSVDAVRAKLVLMHCNDVDAAAGELFRVTKTGGRIAIFDYDFETTTVDHPDRHTTRLLALCASDGHPGSWSGRQLRGRLLRLGARDVSVQPLTVQLPYGFFRRAVGSRLDAALEAGTLGISVAELDAWWEPLIEAERAGLFFASLTGFAVGATR